MVIDCYKHAAGRLHCDTPQNHSWTYHVSTTRTWYRKVEKKNTNRNPYWRRTPPPHTHTHTDTPLQLWLKTLWGYCLGISFEDRHGSFLPLSWSLPWITLFTTFLLGAVDCNNFHLTYCITVVFKLTTQHVQHFTCVLCQRVRFHIICIENKLCLHLY